MYFWLMNPSRDEEIAASVGAHRDLGPAYNDAVAAGLVDRIGAEVDRRVDERISEYQGDARPAVLPLTTCGNCTLTASAHNAWPPIPARAATHIEPRKHHPAGNLTRQGTFARQADLCIASAAGDRTLLALFI
jgi:hypothetical protein